MTVTCVAAKGKFHVGQEGAFQLLDAYFRPFETIRGTIIRLIDGKDALYAMIQTEEGIRPARLSPTVN